MKYAIVFISLALTSACADVESDSSMDWSPTDAPSETGGKADRLDGPVDEGPDILPAPTEVELRSPQDFAEWEVERRCQLPKAVEMPSTEPYVPPATGSPTHLSVSRIDAEGADLPYLAVVPDERHGPAFDYAYDLHAMPGEDVVLHVYARHEARADARFTVTAMVDYKPAPATYTYWREDRSEVIREHTGTGFTSSLVDDFVVIDVTIPAEHFLAGNLHEIGLAVTWPSHPESHFGDESRRFPVFYGGWDVPESLPCATRPAQDPTNAFENDVLEHTRGANHVGIFVDPMPTPRTAQFHEFRASPGETVKVYATLFPRLDVEPDRNIVAVPLLGGVPAGEPRWFGQTGAEEIASIDQHFTHIKPTVNMRYAFEVTMPDEPGDYDVQVMTWADPFVRWRSIEAEPAYGRMNVTNGDHRAGSNVIQFKVRNTF